jgi:hypothetical protein
MYKPVKLLTTSTLAPTTISSFIIPLCSYTTYSLALVLNPLNALKSYYKDSIAYSILEPKEKESSNTKFNSKKKF